MAMLVEFLYHFFSFDLAWLSAFILSPSNLLWLFLFIAAAFYYYCNGKDNSLFWSTVFLVFYIWAASDFSKTVGWQLFNPTLLAILIMANFVTQAFFANDSWGKDRLPMISTLRFLILVTVFNLFLV